MFMHTTTYFSLRDDPLAFVEGLDVNRICNTSSLGIGQKRQYLHLLQLRGCVTYAGVRQRVCVHACMRVVLWHVGKRTAWLISELDLEDTEAMVFRNVSRSTFHKIVGPSAFI